MISRYIRIERSGQIHNKIASPMTIELPGLHKRTLNEFKITKSETKTKQLRGKRR